MVPRKLVELCYSTDCMWCSIFRIDGPITLTISGKMKHSDFEVGSEFYTPTGKWRVTDIGTRTIIVIKLDKDDESWYNGPPYAVPETVFDENDIEGIA